jgi:hypothetical protein
MLGDAAVEICGKTGAVNSLSGAFAFLLAIAVAAAPHLCSNFLQSGSPSLPVHPPRFD